tara:strand:+ start:262 stop:543 length:282 start_codon:yes stop_codon:yes gene_type:complete
MSEWVLYEPDYNKPHCITIFDDGNDIFKCKENTWFICGEWKEKVRMIHADKKTVIQSISRWKVIHNIITTNLEYFDHSAKKLNDSIAHSFPQK